MGASMSVDCDEHTLYLDQGKKDFTVRINVSSGWFTSTKGKPGEEIQGFSPDHFWLGVYEAHERGAGNYIHWQYADAQTHEHHVKGRTVGKCRFNIAELEKKGMLRGSDYVIKLCTGSFVKSIICIDPEPVKITTIAQTIQDGIRAASLPGSPAPQIVNVSAPGSAAKQDALESATEEIRGLKAELRALKKENATLKRKADAHSDDADTDADDEPVADTSSSVNDQARREMTKRMAGSAKKKRKKGE